MNRLLRLSLGLIIVSLIILGGVSYIQAAPERSAAQQVQDAWARVQLAGAYHFATEIEQTTHPAPRLSNVGRSSRVETLYLDGQTNLPQQAMMLTLYQDGGSLLDQGDGVEMRIEGEQAYGRWQGGTWQEIDDVSDAFAPGRDLLAYLAGARNISRADETVTPWGSALTRYTFDLDGAAFGTYLRGQLEDELRRKGELPAGLSLGLSDEYRSIVGGGEVWLDEAGLPARIAVTMEYPQQANGERMTAKIKTDFSNFDRAELARAEAGWVPARVERLLPRDPLAWRDLGAKAGVVLAWLGTMLLLATQLRNPRVYAGFAMAMIVSMVGVPLLQSVQVSAFYERQNDEVAEIKQVQAEREERGTLEEAVFGSSWDPQRNPLAADISAVRVEGMAQQGRQTASAQQPDADSDADGDGLTYEQERNLGTNPEAADTDGDGLRDDLEVKGFRFGSKRWYSNPLDPDTNNDGLLDTLECWGSLPDLTTPSNRACDLDSDRDGTPNLFDRDNDNDGVFDRTDLAPNRVLGQDQYFTRERPFKLVIDNLAADEGNDGYPVLVDFQLRPSDPEHISYAMNILDWPLDSAGQVQRHRDSTFADTMSPADRGAMPSAANGDLRLIPMLEILIPAENGAIPSLPLTVPHTTREFSFYQHQLTLNFTQQGNDIAIEVGDEAGSVEELYFADKLCGETEHTWSDTVYTSGGGSYNLTGLNLNNFIDGGHSVVVTGDQLSWCYNLGDIPNGPYRQQMIDVDRLATHGISVRDADDRGNVVAYAPINVVKGETGGGKVALSARMLYWPNDVSRWGKAHEVRLVWLVQLLGDDLNTQVIHTYNDDWLLTGLDVREDQGLKLGVVFEDPAQEEGLALKTDDSLWKVANALQQTFVSGRDQDQDGQRDITLAEIRARFDNQSNNTLNNGDPRLWGIDRAALQVKTYEYAHQDYIAKLPSEITPDILTDHFLQNGQPVAPATTLLFVREEQYRHAGLEMQDGVVNVAGTQVTIDMAPEKVSPLVLAGMNWGPFRYNNGAWENYPLTKYQEYLAVNLAEVFKAVPPLDENDRPLFDPNSPDADEILTGMTTAAQAQYLTLNVGTSGMPDLGTAALATAKVAYANNDTDLAQQTINTVGGGIEFVVDAVANDFFSSIGAFKGQYAAAATAQQVELDTFGNLFGTKKSRLAVLGSAVKGTLTDAGFGMKTSLAAGVGNTVLSGAQTGVAVTALAFSIAGSFTGDDWMKEATLALGVAGTTLDMVSTIKDIATAKGTGVLNKMASASKNVSNASTIAAAALTVIAIGVTVGVFIATMVASGVRFGSIEFNAALAGTIATVVATVILFAISMIPVVGQIIAAIIGLVDAIVNLICNVFLDDEDKDDVSTTQGGFKFDLCGGLSGFLTEAIRWSIFNQTALVGNMTSKSMPRTNIGDFDPRLVAPEQGYVDGNSIRYSMNIETAITLADVPIDWKAAVYAWQYTYSRLRSSTFKYALRPPVWHFGQAQEPEDLSVSRDQMRSGWTHQNDFYGSEDALVNYQSLVAVEVLTHTGINVPAKLYLSESSAIPVQECWGIPTPPAGVPLIPVCYIRTKDDDIHTDLGKTVQWDILPSTLDEFYACESSSEEHPCNKDGGFSLAWGQDGELTFPRMKDFDGDGLLNPADGGSDPNDSKFDSDNDGLGDPFELQQGSDAQLADTDGDGLTDLEETLLGTNPARADSDGDGLTDKQEVDGWEFVYDFDAEDRPMTTWVTADPLSIDGDGDELTDWQEYVFGFHPLVVSDPNVLNYESLVREIGAPAMILRFEELQGATTFSDISGDINNAFCNGDACPVSGHLGKFGNAAVFDGVDDLLTVETVAARLNEDTFSFGAWAKPDSGLVTGVVAAFESGHRLYYNGNDDRFYYSDGAVTVSSNVTAAPDTWHHVMVTLDAANSGTLYLDGQPVGSFNSTDRPAADDQFYLGGVPAFGQSFQGRIDEAVVVPEALTAAEVAMLRAARYNPNDLIVKPGDTLAYTGVVENKLTNRIARGLLSTDFPGVLESRVDPVTFVLQPRQSITMTGELTVRADASSGPVNLTQKASGSIVENNNHFVTNLDSAVVDFSFDTNSYHYGPDYATCSGHLCPRESEGIDGPGGGAGVDFWGEQYFRLDDYRLNLNGHPFSFAMWLKPYESNTNRWQGVFGNSRFHWADTESYPSLAVRNGRDLKFGFSQSDGNGYFIGHTSENVLTPEAWNHVVITFDGETYKLYVNSKLKDQTSDPFGGENPVNASDIYLGRASNKAWLKLKEIHIDNERDGDDSDAELYIEFNGERIFEEEDGDADETIILNQEHMFEETARLEIWEDDGEKWVKDDKDDLVGVLTFNTNQVGHAGSHFFDEDESEDTTLTLYYELVNPSSPYWGQMDEFAMYKRVLSGEEIAAMHQSGNVVAHFAFDDPPGRGYNSFGLVNSVDPSGRSNFTCTVNCPTNGVAGRDNQALFYDGRDHSYVYGTMFLPEGGFSLAAWVKPIADEGDEVSRTILSFGTFGVSMMRTAEGKLAVEGLGQIFEGGEVPLNLWSHVAYVSNGWENWLYINGKQVAYRNYASPARGGSQLGVGGRSGLKSWLGYIDEVYVFREALDNPAINDLYQAVPQFLMHFDEPVGATSFTNEATQEDQTCGTVVFKDLHSSNANPMWVTLFVDGIALNPEQIYISNYADLNDMSREVCGEAVLTYANQNVDQQQSATLRIDESGHSSLQLGFIRVEYEVQDIYQQETAPICWECPVAGVKGQLGLAAQFAGTRILEFDAPDLFREDFTAMAWVRPDLVDGARYILGAGVREVNQGLHLGIRDGKPYFGFFGNDTAGTTELHPGFWYHLTFRYDAADREQAIFVNGILDTAEGNHDPYQGNGKVNIGCSFDNPYTCSSYFKGRMDELTIYQRPLNPYEIRATFVNQGRQVEERHIHETIVDAEPPTSLLRSYNPGLANYRANQAVLFDIEAVDPTSYVTLAELGVRKDGQSDFTWVSAPACQGADGNAAWCPTFDPTAFGGEGTYTMRTRSIDAVGHLETPTDDYTVFVDDTPPSIDAGFAGAIPGRRHPDIANAWAVPLTFRVDDPVLNSGDPGSGVTEVRATLVNAAGAVAGAGPQFAHPTSAYIYHSSDTPLDMPDAYEYWGWYSDNIAPGQTMAEIDVPVDSEITDLNLTLNIDHRRLEDLAIYLISPGGRQIALAEQGDLGGAGLLGTVFDDEAGFTLAEGTAPYSGRFKPAAALSDLNGSSSQGTWQLHVVDHALGEAGRLEGWSLEFSLARNTESEWGVDYIFYDADPSGAYTLTIEAEDAVGLRRQAVIPNVVIDAAAPNVSLDLAAVPTDTLTSRVMLSGQTDAAGSLPAPGLHLPLDEASGVHSFKDTVDANRAASCSGGTCPAAGVVGVQNSALLFDGSNDLVQIDALVLNDQSFTLAAWAKRNSTGSYDMLLTQGNASSNQSLHFGFRDNDRFTCAFWGNDLDSPVYTDNEWHHWACTYDAPTGRRTLYRDGVEVAQDTPSTAYQGSGTLYLGGFDLRPNWALDGYLDEVRIYKTALNIGQVQDLATGNQAQAVQLSFAPLNANYPLYNEQPPTGQLLHLLLDDTADHEGQVSFDDVGPDGTNGQCNGDECPVAGVSGRLSLAAAFNGQQQIGVPLNAPPGPFSLAAWVNYAADFDAAGHVATGSQPTLPPLLLHLPLDEAAGATGFSDSSGNNHPAQCDAGVGNCPAAAQPGRFNYALNFDGNGDHIFVPHHTDFDFGTDQDFSVAVWVKMDGSNGDPAIIANKDWHSGYNPGFVLASTGNWQLNVGDGQDRIDVEGGHIADGQWHHLVVTFDRDGEAILYQDGAQVGRTAMSRIDNINTGYPIALGQDGTRNYGYRFRGQMDDVRIFDTALNADTVRVLFQAGADPAATLHTYLPLDEAAGATTFANTGDGGDASCEGTACPVAGVAGHRNNALQFDNSNDLLRLPAIELDNRSFTLAAWAKRNSIGSYDILMAQGNTNNNQTLHFGFRENNQFTCAFWANDLNTPVYTDNDWHHWVCTYDAAAGTRTIYRDGVAVASDRPGAPYAGSGEVNVGGFALRNTWTFDGMLDEVRVYQRALSQDQVQDLFVGPDEPQALAAVGDRHTVMAFGNDGPGLFVTGDGRPLVDGVVQGSPIQTNTWTHLAYTWDRQASRLYTNGALVAETDVAPPQTGFDLSIGGSADHVGWQGLLDDVQVFERALLTTEVRSLFRGSGALLALSFDETTAINGSTFSDEAGWGHLAQLSTGPGDTANKVVAGQVGQYALKLDGRDDYVQISDHPAFNFDARSDFSLSLWVRARTWLGDPVIIGNQVLATAEPNGFALQGSREGNWWTFNLADGTNQVRLNGGRISDDVWHHLVVSVDRNGSVTLYQDGVQVDQQSSAGLGDINPAAPLVLGQDAGLSYPYAFGGQIDDVRLYARALNPVEVKSLRQIAWQAATVEAGGTWRAPVPGDLEGNYRLDLRQVSADGPGTYAPNQWQGMVDTQAPWISTERQVVQVPPGAEPPAPIVHIPFDEAVGSDGIRFVDVSGNEHHAEKYGQYYSAPQPGRKGVTGRAAEFPGVLVIDGVDLAYGSFSLSVWAKRDSLGADHYILGQGKADRWNTDRILHMGFRSNNKFTCAFYSNDLDSPQAYSDTDWHHWVCTYDADTGTRILYRDGEKVAEDTAAKFRGRGDGALFVGAWHGSSQYAPSEYFDGLVDDLRAFDRALTPDEVQLILSDAVSANAAQTYRYTTVARDFNLVEAGFGSACGAADIDRRIYFAAPWYRALSQQDQKLYQLTTACDTTDQTTVDGSGASACDSLGNCSTGSAVGGDKIINVDWTTDGYGSDTGLRLVCDGDELAAYPAGSLGNNSSFSWQGYVDQWAACEVTVTDSYGDGGVTGLVRVDGVQVANWAADYGDDITIPFTAYRPDVYSGPLLLAKWTTDHQAGQTGLTLNCDGEEVFRYEPGSLNNNTAYLWKGPVEPNVDCNLTLTDTANNGGSVGSLAVDGEPLVNWAADYGQETTVPFGIRGGKAVGARRVEFSFSPGADYTSHSASLHCGDQQWGGLDLNHGEDYYYGAWASVDQSCRISFWAGYYGVINGKIKVDGHVVKNLDAEASFSGWKYYDIDLDWQDRGRPAINSNPAAARQPITGRPYVWFDDPGLNPLRVVGGQAMTFTGRAGSAAGLQDLQFMVDGSPVDTVNWAGQSLTETNWLASWTPAVDGEHVLAAVMQDQTGRHVTDTRTITVDGRPWVSLTAPAEQALLTDLQPTVISATAFAPYNVKAITLTVDSVPVYTQTWPTPTLTRTRIGVLWTPEREGEHRLAAIVRDSHGNEQHRMHSVLVDVQGPQLSVHGGTTITTTTAARNQLEFTGLVSDTGGLRSVAVALNGDPLPVVLDNDNRWTARWFFDPATPPDNLNATLVATATDVAGQQNVLSRSLTIDLVPPTVPALTLYQRQPSNGTALLPTLSPITETVTLRQPDATLVLTWTTGSGGDLAGYRLGWRTETGNDLTPTDLWEQFAPDNAGESAKTFSGEAQKVSLSLAAEDTQGNLRWQSLAPVYLDSPLTPDFSDVAGFATAETLYRGWLDSGCSLLGVDNRIRDYAQDGAALDSAQRFYGTWDDGGLRLTWTGADWDTDGDLFIYLDTRAGGSSTAYNPYPQTISNTSILLPQLQPNNRDLQRRSAGLRSLANSSHALRSWAEEQLERATGAAMAADYVIWVRNNTTATLLQWQTDAGWQAAGTEWAFRVSPNLSPVHTDLYLPFGTLGVKDPAATPLSMVALASEDDALRLWATMPGRNSVTSNRVLAAHRSDSLTQFPLLQHFAWDNLGAGVCPNGRQPSAATAMTPFSGADVGLALTAQPGGISYSVLGDNLVDIMPRLSQFADLADWNALQAELCQFASANPDCGRSLAAGRNRARSDEGLPLPGSGVSLADIRRADNAATIDFDAELGLRTVQDSRYPYLGDGRPVTYTLRYVNRGDELAIGLKADILTWGQMRLPDGTLLSDEFGQYDWLLLDLGNLAPGEEKYIEFMGRTDFSFDPDNDVGWATVDIIIYDDSGSVYRNQLDWLYLDHRLDQAAPQVGLQAQPALLGPGMNTILGYAFDDSAVPSVEVEVENGERTTCPDTTPDNGRWTCEIDLGNRPDGETVRVRARATDEYGHTGDWSPWLDYMVDAVPPTLELDTLGRPAAGRNLVGPNDLSFSGLISDNHRLASLQVCLDDTCTLSSGADLVINQQSQPPASYRYIDQPDVPPALNAQTACYSGGEIERTFTVPESFTVAEVELGLTVEHPWRYDVTAWLVAPSGTWANLIFNGSEAANYDIVLKDSALQPNATDRDDHVVAGPHFEHERRPDQPLSTFKGEASQGDWRLILCDYFPESDDGAYLGAELRLQPAQIPANDVAAWRFNLPDAANLDGVARTVQLYGLDAVGNRSADAFTLALLVDTVAPAITVTHVATALQRADFVLSSTGKLTDALVIHGLISDGNTIATLQLNVLNPAGTLTAENLTPDAGNWQYKLPLTFPGDYRLWVVAADAAGNETSLGPFTVAVALADGNAVYLPLVMKGGQSGTGSLLTPTPVSSLTPTLAAADELPPPPDATPTATLSPAPTLVPTLGLTVTVTVTPTATATATVVPTGIPAVTPTSSPTPTPPVLSNEPPPAVLE